MLNIFLKYPFITNNLSSIGKYNFPPNIFSCKDIDISLIELQTGSVNILLLVVNEEIKS